MTAHPTDRLHALDAVRGFALIAGIVFHATVSFMPSPQGIPLWVIMDNDRSVVLGLTFHILHIFRMATFFLIAGFFGRMMLERRGPKTFVLDRLKRIGIPLVVGWPIIIAAISAAAVWGAVMTAAATGAPVAEAPPSQPFPAFPLTHLWFLYVLLWLYIGVLAMRGLAKLGDPGGRLARLCDPAVRFLATNPLGLILLAAPLAVAFWTRSFWIGWMGIPTPDMSLVPNIPALIAYGGAFGFGWLVHRQMEVVTTWGRQWAVYLGIALLTTVAGLWLTGLEPYLMPIGHDLKGAAYTACYAIGVWAWTFAFIGLAVRFLSDHSPVRRYIADASYWLYLIHLPIIIALQVAVSQLGWPWFVKYPVILAVAFPIMFASYHLLVRFSFIGWVLNGRRQPKPNRAESLDTAIAKEPAQ